MAFNFEDGVLVASLNTTNSGLPDGFDNTIIATEAEVEDLTGDDDPVDKETALEANLPDWLKSDGLDEEYNSDDTDEAYKDGEIEESLASNDLNLLAFEDAQDDLEKHLPEG